MQVVTISAVVGVMLGSAWVHAADSLSGKYTGSFVGQGRTLGATLVINSSQDGLIKGIATRTAGGCAGDYPVEGKLNGKNLKLTSTAMGGSVVGCSISWDLRLDGDKLVGTTGSGNAIELSK